MEPLNVLLIVSATLIATPMSVASAESYSCQLQVFEGPDHDANVKPWVVSDGKITLGYRGDLIPTPPLSFPVVKDDADQLVAVQYFKSPSKGPNSTEMLIIDKHDSKVDFFKILPGASYIEHYSGRCASP